MISFSKCVAGATLLLTFVTFNVDEVYAGGQDTEIVNVCGTDYWDATKCGQKCPTGDPATCPTNEMCYANIECPINGDPTFWCGTDYNDALTCHAACPSGDPASCPKNEMCYANIFSCASGKSGKKVLMTSAGSDTNWCGTTYSDALDCHAPCPSGMDGECPAGEHCFAGISCTDGDPTNWCGVDYASALDCHAACPYGTSGECPSGESCFNGITGCSARSAFTKSRRQAKRVGKTAASNPTYWCGKDYADALTCHAACPSGSPASCPAGEMCYAGITSCFSTTSGKKVLAKSASSDTNWCGTTYSDALNCHAACPSGMDGECPAGEHCFAGISCTGGDPTNWCGVDYSSALDCHTACPYGTNGECPSGESCFNGITSCSVRSTFTKSRCQAKRGGKILADTNTNWCGRTYADALNCHAACPSGMDGECPAGEYCFAGIECSPGDPTNWCGRDYSSALDCHAACPYGSDGECPSGEACYNGIAQCATRRRRN